MAKVVAVVEKEEEENDSVDRGRGQVGIFVKLEIYVAVGMVPCSSSSVQKLFPGCSRGREGKAEEGRERER